MVALPGDPVQMRDNVSAIAISRVYPILTAQLFRGYRRLDGDAAAGPTAAAVATFAKRVIST
jgi:hypothetical protein